MPPAPDAPACTSNVAAPETSAVLKLVKSAGAVMSGLLRPLSIVGPVADGPPYAATAIPL